MLVLSYFDRILGPKVFLTNPQNLIKSLEEDYINQIKSLMESESTGFFTHNFSSDFKTANWAFNLDSKWARGRSESAMISLIVSEEEPDYSAYEIILSKFVEKLKNIPELYKAFYINSDTITMNKKEIQHKFTLLKEELNNLYKILIIKKIETEGQLISLSKLKKTKNIELSNDVIQKLSKLTENKKHCFLVFRTRGEALKLDVIPVETDEIFNLIIMFGEQMTVSVLQEISKILSKYEDNLKLVFTTGICQEVDKCIYEVYLEIDIDMLNSLIEDLYKVNGIIEMDVKLIKSQ
ncbi:MAG: hypothetical protein ACFFDK_13465 [Promethearchaeota archaeon]